MPVYLVTPSDGQPVYPVLPGDEFPFFCRARSAQKAAEKFVTTRLGCKPNGSLGHYAACVPLGDGRFQAQSRDPKRHDRKVMVDMDLTLDVRVADIFGSLAVLKTTAAARETSP